MRYTKSMQILRDVISDAKAKRVAIGHFNFSTLESFWGIVLAARTVGVPAILAVSEGERDYVGIREAMTLVHTVREETGHPLYLNADHTYSFDRVREAIDCGYDAVIFDGVKLAPEDATAQTKEVVAYARASGRDVLIEGELGYIGTSSKLLEEIPEGAGLQKTTPEEAVALVSATGIDLLAPSVGNIHGMLKGGNPKLDIELIGKIASVARVPLVLHGGSGISDSDFVAAISAGMRIVHINTEIRVAYRKGIESALATDPDEVAPYKYLAHGRDAMKEVVLNRIKLFGNL